MPACFDELADSSESEGRHIVINALVLSFGNQIGFMPNTNIAAVADSLAKARPGRQMGEVRALRVPGESPTSNAAAGPFSTQPSGPWPVGCFSALLARPVSVQIWALRSRLEKQPTDPAPAGRCHHYMRDGTRATPVAENR